LDIYGNVIRDSDIVPDVQVGDKVYFNYTALDIEGKNLRKDEATGELYFFLSYYHVIAVERQGQIITIGGYGLFEPIKDEQLQTASKIWLKEFAEKQPSFGILRHANHSLLTSTTPTLLSSLIGFKCVLSSYHAITIEIGGNEYYAARETELLAYMVEAKAEVQVGEHSIVGSKEIDWRLYGFYVELSLPKERELFVKKGSVYVASATIRDSKIYKALKVGDGCELVEEGKDYIVLENKIEKHHGRNYIHEKYILAESNGQENN
jgi:co-chaperonin GroES (HSP10)